MSHERQLLLSAVDQVKSAVARKFLIEALLPFAFEVDGVGEYSFGTRDDGARPAFFPPSFRTNT